MAGKSDNGDGTAGEKPRGDWREILAAMARRVLDDEELGRLRERAGEVGGAGDMMVAAHLDDLLFVERARFHRARRDVGRAMATGSRADVTVAQDRLRAVAAGLGVLRLQRDLATGKVQLDVGGDPGKDRR